MAHTLAPQSFFADEIYHHRDEHTICDELSRRPLALPPAPSNFAFQPLLPTASSLPGGASAPAQAMKVDNALRIQIPSVLADDVPAEDYTPISEADWTHVEIDYDAPSPISAPSSADSPVTPGLSGATSESYADRFFAEGHHSGNTVAQAFYQAQGVAAKPFVPALSQSAAPSAFQLPVFGYPGYLDASGSHLNLTTANLAYHVLAPAPQHGTTVHTGVATHYQSDTLHAEPFAPLQPSNALPLRAVRDGAESVSNGSSSAYSTSERGSIISQSSFAEEPASVPYADFRDRVLLEKRKPEIDWSYRKIKEVYKLRDAESTLRGRHRMLTKDKDERVRKPVWTPRDEKLLIRAFNKYRNSRGKVPWKKCGEYIKKRGGTYSFGGSTCAKKLDELKAAGRV